MKRLIRLRLLSVLLPLAMLALWSPGQSRAQGHGVSSLGTDFWMGFMPDYTIPVQHVYVFICSGTANTVIIDVLGGGNGGPIQSLRRTLVAGEAQTIELDVAKVETRRTETPDYRAVHVTSTNPLAVYGFSNLTATSDGYLALPTPALGKEYYTANYYDDWYYSPSEPLAGEFLIVAPYDNTTVKLTTTSDTRSDATGLNISHTAYQPWSVTLMKGQTYLVQAPGRDKGNDITGSHLVSDKPIALLSGHQRCSIPNDVVDDPGNSKDLLIEMIPSLDKWGTQYFDAPMIGRTLCGDYIRLIGGHDGTEVSVDGLTNVYLNAGDFSEQTYVLSPQVYTSINNDGSRSTKGFLTEEYAYSQGVHNDPFPADPFMINMTPQEQFQKIIIFRTPINKNSNGDFTHYSTFIGEADSLLNIQLNGKSLLSWGATAPKIFNHTSNPVMGAVQIKLTPGEFTYVAKSGAPFGLYLYGFTAVDGYGWPAGMAQNIPSRDTLPPLQDTIASCGDYTVKLFELRHIPAFSFEDTRISSVSMITDPADTRWHIPSFNYTFSLSPAFVTGDSTTNFTLNVIDPAKDAYAAIYTIDQAGNDTVYQYSYSAPKFTLSPKPDWNYGNVLVGHDSCMTITLTNAQASQLKLQGIHLQQTAKGGTFTVSPNSDQTVNVGGTLQFNLCYTPSDTGALNTSFDSLLFQTGCVPWKFAMQGVGVTPLIYATDINFGVVLPGNTSCKDLIVTNKGTADLVINKQDLPNTTEFTVTPPNGFPIVLKPGESIKLNACFHPSKQGSFQTTDLFSTLNPAKFARSIKDTSVLIGQSFLPGARLTSYTEGFLAKCGETPVIIDTVYDPEQVDDVITSADISGPDAASFSIVGFTPGNGSYPVALAKQPAPGIFYTLKFDPTVKGMLAGVRTAYLNVHTQSGILLTATLTADSKSAVLTVTPGSASTVNFGTTLINQTLPGQFIVKNTGNDDLVVSSITLSGADAPSYSRTTATPTPYTLVPGAQQIELYTFTAGTVARQYTATATVNVSANNCTTPQQQNFIAAATSTGYDAQAPDYSTVYTCRTKDLTASFTNFSSSDTAYLESAVPTNINGWLNASDFQQVPVISTIQVAPGQTVTLPVRFIPTATGVRNAGLVFTYTTPKGTDTLIRELTGIGANVAEIVGVGTVASVPQGYSGHAGDPINVPILISTPFQTATNEVYGYDFSVSWFEDAFTLENNGLPVAPSGITFTQTKDAVDPVTHIETFTFHATSANPLTTETTLGTLNLKVDLDTNSATGITLSNVSFNDNLGQPICYIATTQQGGNFSFIKNCGDQTIQNDLAGNKLQLNIAQIDPNPVRSKAQINYRVNKSLTNVTLGVFDALGNRVANLVDGRTLNVGSYVANFDGSKLASGSYFIRLTDGTTTVTKELILSK